MGALSAQTHARTCQNGVTVTGREAITKMKFYITRIFIYCWHVGEQSEKNM